MVELDLSDNEGPFRLFVNKEDLEDKKQTKNQIVKNKNQKNDVPRSLQRWQQQQKVQQGNILWILLLFSIFIIIQAGIK